MGSGSASMGRTDTSRSCATASRSAESFAAGLTPKPPHTNPGASASAASAAGSAYGCEVEIGKLRNTNRRRSPMLDDLIGVPAVRALEVAMLDQRHRGVRGPLDMVADFRDRHDEPRLPARAHADRP